MADSLIEQLQIGAIDGTTPVADLLRKAKLAAVKLDQADFARWVSKELQGYTSSKDDYFPDYRLVVGEIKVFNPYNGWLATGLNERMPIVQAIAQIEKLSESDSGKFLVSVPDAFGDYIRKKIGFNFEVKFHASTSALSAIIDGVRNSVLEWALKLEKAGVRGDGLSFSESDKAMARTASNHYIFNGPVAGFNQGSGSISGTVQQNASASVQEMVDAVAALIAALQASAVATAPTAAATELVEVQKELSAGRVPFARIRGVLGGLRDVQDLAIRAPEVAQKVQALWQMFGG